MHRGGGKAVARGARAPNTGVENKNDEGKMAVGTCGWVVRFTAIADPCLVAANKLSGVVTAHVRSCAPDCAGRSFLMRSSPHNDKIFGKPPVVRNTSVHARQGPQNER